MKHTLHKTIPECGICCQKLLWKFFTAVCFIGSVHCYSKVCDGKDKGFLSKVLVITFLCDQVSILLGALGVKCLPSIFHLLFVHIPLSGCLDSLPREYSSTILAGHAAHSA